VPGGGSFDGKPKRLMTPSTSRKRRGFWSLFRGNCFTRS